MKLTALVSGGKDSLYAMYLAKKENKIDSIISIKSENTESYMFHVPNIDLVKEQARLMDVKLIEKISKGIKEEELEDIRDVLSDLKNHGVEGAVTGAVQSNYQKERIDKICKDLGIKSIAPLWHCDQEKYLRDLVKNFKVVIISVAAPPLDEKWLGREMDNKMIDELIILNKKYGISLVGEGGEFDTFVTDCPMYNRKIVIEDTENIWDAKTQSGYMIIKKIREE
ncbi:MAG: diphthine--ammonia ligase [Candidatus Aenigmarchaeota archaeon]|nr:diphthine--ammonia ligase [Candidatus Aenigmarchaeota archaeon]